MKRFLSFLLLAALLLSLLPGIALAAEETAEAVDVLGVKDAGRYENTFFGLAADLGDGWRVLSDAEAAVLLNPLTDKLEDQTLAELLRGSGVVCDLYALSTDGSGDSLNVQIEDLGFLYGVVMGEDVYSEAAIPLLEDTLRQAGLTALRVEKETLDFAGGEHVALRVSGTLDGTPLYERIALVKAGNYMAIVTAFSLDPARAESLLALFTAPEDENSAA